MTIAETLTDMGVTMVATLARDEFDGHTNRNGQSVWAITIVRNGQSMQVPYSMGPAHKPTLDDVLWSIVMDAQCVAYGETFEEFSENLGYDEDSRKAEKAFNACRDEYFGLIRLFGQDGFEELGELFQDY